MRCDPWLVFFLVRGFKNIVVENMLKLGVAFNRIWPDHASRMSFATLKQSSH